jgi:MFS-type transporter involved in bile tolerance (Atg22 family)
MMIVFMPVAGHGFFGLSFGIAAPIATLVLHLVFGAVLGAVYASTRSAAAIANIPRQSRIGAKIRCLP